MKMEHYLEQLDLTEMMEQLDGFFVRGQWDMPGLFDQILKGNLKEAAALVWKGIGSGFGAELAGMKEIFVSILILGLLSVLVSGFLTGFENHQIAEIAHSIFYLLMLAVLLKIFSSCYETARRTLELLVQFSRLVLPALCLSLGPAAGSLTAAGYYELALLLIFFMESLLYSLCLPLLPVLMLLLLMNGVWEEGKLAPLMELVKKGLMAAAKFSLAAVAGLGFLQSMVAPALDGLKRTAAQKAVTAIPGIGALAEGTTQLLLGSAVLIKNSLGVFALLFLGLLIAVPLGEIFLYGALLRLAGALVGMVADRRLTACMLSVSDILFLTLRLLGSAAACFVIMIAIVVCLTG